MTARQDDGALKDMLHTYQELTQGLEGLRGLGMKRKKKKKKNGGIR